MRIVGGMWRGRTFEAPEGRGTRPTTDRLRESVASMVLSARELDLAGCAVLDAFAGSGGMGLELLSRGASWCTFCERDRRAASLVRNNCKALGAHTDTWQVICADVFRLPGMPQVADARFDVVFLDPPYAMPSRDVARLVEGLGKGRMLAQGCLVVYERSAQGDPLDMAGFATLRTKRHGTTCVDLMQKEKDT